MQNISPVLWFNSEAEDAAEFYVSVFPNSAITTVSRYGEGAPQPVGSAMVVVFELDGTTFQALNGGPGAPFTEAVSFLVSPTTQQEIDSLWAALTSDGGSPGQCGWLTDKYGVSWQIVPPVLVELLSSPDPAVAGRVMQALLVMRKISIAELHAAAQTP